ncbi:MAG TPA: hypothetical protein VFR37_01725 [Longimicrobium sp.]|nr:hypothetical protein [Longimicrobium sp.]
MHRLILLLALVLALPAPAAAQPVALTGADRAAIVQQVLRARRGELNDAVPVDRAALVRVLGSEQAADSALASVPEDCGQREQRGRWSIQALEPDGDAGAVLRADRVESGGTARTEAYRLRRGCSPAGTCTWWLVDVRLSGFESNDEAPLPR